MFSDFKKIDEFYNSSSSAYQKTEEIQQHFLEALKNNLSFQLKHNEFMRFIFKRNNINLDGINNINDIVKLPYVFVGLMKKSTFLTVEDKDIFLRLTSSGTSGEKTQLLLDEGSLGRLNGLAYNCFRDMGYVSNTPVHYFLQAYDPKYADNVGTSWSDEQISKLAPAASKHWTLEWDDTLHEFNFDAKKYAKKIIEIGDSEPIRLLGFPAFIYKLSEEIMKIKGKIKLHQDSFIIAGGGWKNHIGEPMTFESFSAYIEDTIGLKKENIRDTYGMAEHGVPYCSCSHGNIHVPIYGELIVRSPLSMKKLPYGEQGLLQLITSYNIAQPNQSVLSTDLVTVSPECTCGLPGEIITSIRRGGIRKHRGCAIAAQDILKKVKA